MGVMLLIDYICIYGDVCAGGSIDAYRFVMYVLYEEEALYRGCF